MSVPVKRIQRHKIWSDTTSPLLYYLKQDSGSSKTSDIAAIAREIETTGALSAEDVTHTMKAFVRELKKVLTEGNRVKVDGLGTFYITFRNKGVEEEKDCTVKNINRVYIRFMVDNTLRLVNDSVATTRGADNNVKFYVKGESTSSSSGSGNTDPDDGGGDDWQDPDA